MSSFLHSSTAQLLIHGRSHETIREVAGMIYAMGKKCDSVRTVYGLPIEEPLDAGLWVPIGSTHQAAVLLRGQHQVGRLVQPIGSRWRHRETLQSVFWHTQKTEHNATKQYMETEHEHYRNGVLYMYCIGIVHSVRKKKRRRRKTKNFISPTVGKCTKQKPFPCVVFVVSY